MPELMSKEAATAELNKWLDFQDISKEQRKETESNINIIVRAMQDGRVVISENKEIIQKLKHPFGEKVKIGELKYKATPITVGEVESFRANVPADVEGRNLMATMGAACGETYSVLSKMSTKDYNISAAIIIFFMV